MAILSEEMTLSDDQALTATAASTNYLDRGAPGTPQNAAAALAMDMGAGAPVPFDVLVTEDFVGGTSVQAVIQADNDSAFGTPTTVLTGPAVAVADANAGVSLLPHLSLPTGITERYVRINYVVVGVPTAGKVFAGITGGRRTNLPTRA